jgi:XTP/dITP diphosphohydrolase
VLVRSADDPQPLIADGEWHGEIIEDARGAGGFGYDPHFFVPSLEQTAAELDAELKNTLSHRASAMRHLLSRLQGLQGLLTG